MDPMQPSRDSVGNGVPDLIKFLQGSDPAGPAPLLALDAVGQLTLRMKEHLAGVDIRIESSTDLQNWAQDDFLVFIGESTPSGDVLARSYRISTPDTAHFYRLRASLLP
jgi:hypothetical protein